MKKNASQMKSTERVPPTSRQQSVNRENAKEFYSVLRSKISGMRVK